MVIKRAKNEPRPRSALKRIFDEYADETVSDEQIRRVVEPVEKMILAGRFGRARRIARLLKLFAAAAAVVSVCMVRPAARCRAYTPISDAAVPLAGVSFFGNELSGRIYSGDEGVGGADVYLVGAEKMEYAAKSVTDKDGVYSFSGFPRGEYLLKMDLPDGFALSEDGGEGLVKPPGGFGFVFEKDSGQKMGEVDISVWKIG